jgi:hypothetical protein
MDKECAFAVHFWDCPAQRAGFKFVSRKEPIPVVIIDHIAPPTPN